MSTSPPDFSNLLPASWPLRLARSTYVPRKLGLCERLFARKLAARGITWVDFGDLRWKLNLSNATHRWLVYGEYEQPELRMLLEQLLTPGAVIVDSGANIGQMVLMYLLYGAADKIYAFEPTPTARAWLEESLAANNEKRVSVAPVALGARQGRSRLLTFAFDFKEGAQNRISDQLGHEEAIEIEITTLDHVANHSGIERIRFWKLDTEGHELPALQGATNLLARSAIDCLYVETADQGAAIFDLLSQFHYVATDVRLRTKLSREQVIASFSNYFLSQSEAAAHGLT